MIPVCYRWAIRTTQMHLFRSLSNQLIAIKESITPDSERRVQTDIGNKYIPFPKVIAFRALFSIIAKIWTFEKDKKSRSPNLYGKIAIQGERNRYFYKERYDFFLKHTWVAVSFIEKKH